MPTLFRPHDRLARRLLLVLAVALLPVAVVWQLMRTEAQRQMDNDVAGSARFVLKQTDAILDHAVRMSNSLAMLVGRDCADAQQTLQPEGTLQPYFRSLMLVRQDTVYCSSATGPENMPVNDVLPDLDELPLGRHFYLVPGSPLVPGRAALVITLGLSKGRGVLVTVDGQYLLDAMRAASEDGNHLIALKIAGSTTSLDSRSPVPADEYPELHQQLRSTTYPVVIDVRNRNGLIAAYRGKLWKYYLPYMLALALAAGWAALRVYRKRTSMRTDLVRGMARGQFHVAYQPVIDLRTHRCTGAEALLRWEHPLHKTVSPEVFIPLAEANGLAIALTRHMLGLVRRDLLASAPPPGFTVNVNIVAEHLCSEHIVADIESFLTGIDRARMHFCLEVTERSPLPQSQPLLVNMRVLQSMGLTIAIDDFGTGHSTLDYLEKYRIDALKIDRRFLAGIASAGADVPVLNAIISLGRQMQLKLVAEGVESELQADYLAARGVDFAQGYLYARPSSWRDLLAWLEHDDQRAAAETDGHA